MSPNVRHKKTDKQGYNLFYRERVSSLSTIRNPDDYVQHFQTTGLSPYYQGGGTKGYVRGLAVSELLKAAGQMTSKNGRLTVLDAGCGLGELSAYLACKGFDVVGVDISIEACKASEYLAEQLGIAEQCVFLAESLEDLSVPDSSIDFIIGHAALHHFIKYDGIPTEFQRIMKVNSKGFFADGYSENAIYQIFHDKEKMERLGDVILSKGLITDYFRDFQVDLMPTDWFVMLDKLYLRMLPKNYANLIRRLSRAHFWLDRRIPDSNRLSLFLSGTVMTVVTRIN